MRDKWGEGVRICSLQKCCQVGAVWEKDAFFRPLEINNCLSTTQETLQDWNKQNYINKLGYTRTILYGEIIEYKRVMCSKFK